MEIKYRTQFGELLAHFGLSGHGAEIGVAEGRNAEVIASWDCITKLYLIDAWRQMKQKGDGAFSQEWHDNNFSETQRRMLPFGDKAVLCRGLSGEMIGLIPDESLVFAYIDGDHSYAGCKRDLELISKKVMPGGIIAGHDYLNAAYGVGRAVRELGRDVHQTEEGGDLSMVSFWFRK